MTAPPIVTYLLRHGDDNLVLAQRLGEYISRAPELEEDIALANIALDHLGQARYLLSYAGAVESGGRSEDDLAFHRDEREFRNVLLVEQPNGDFAEVIARQYLFDAYQVPLWDELRESKDKTLAGIAAKALKEARYHLRHSSGWVIRLGDGTDESHRRMQAAINALWRFTGELFHGDDVEAALVADRSAIDPAELRHAWDREVSATLAEATLEIPQDPFQRSGGRDGLHTEHLGHLLAEMQYVQRSFPGLEW